MKNLLYFLLAAVLFAFIHEGTHALAALCVGEYQAFHVRPFGFEVTYVTPVSERVGSVWAFVSGSANAFTLLLGYLLFAARRRIAAYSVHFFKHLGYWATVLFMLLDPLNLSIGPFIYNGDAMGIAVGLGVSRYVVQAIAFAIVLLNRELIVQAVFPAFMVRTRHPLFQPLRRVRSGSSPNAE